MKNLDEIMLVPRAEGFQAWRARGQGGAVPEAEARLRGGHPGWIALPARQLISVPLHLPEEVSRRESAAQLELEAAGLGRETEEASSYELIGIGTNERHPIATAFIQAAPLSPEILAEGDDARFAPSVTFHVLQPGEAQIWNEAGHWVLAIPRSEGGVLHCQALTARRLDGDAAAEVRCVLAALELGGFSPDLQFLSVVTADATVVSPAFEHGLDLSVQIRAEAPPVAPAQAGRLVPASVLKRRQERQQRRMTVMAALSFAAILIAALGAFAIRVGLREHSLTKEERRLNALEPELAAIREAQSAWSDMLSAVSPEQYPVETLHQLIQLLPNEGIRLTRFELREDSIVLDGEASSLGHGIDFRDKLMAAPQFKRWVWEFPQPTSLPDGRATFRAEGRPGESEDVEVVQL